MFNKLFKRIKSVFTKEKKVEAKNVTKTSIVNSNNNVREFKVVHNDIKEPMKCQNCSKEVGEDNIKSAMSNDNTYYYSRCSCGFVNKIVDNKSYIPDLLDVKDACELFRKNGVNFGMYSTTQHGEKHVL